MPGNEVGDRVHNFFAQDNLSQGQHRSQVVDGNWPVLNNNLWVGSQGQLGLPGSSPKNNNLQQSDRERGHTNHPLHAPHGLNSAQSTLRPEFERSQSQGQQPNLNGYMYGNQVFQTRQDETNFLGVDTESDQHNLTSRGLSVYDSQQRSGCDYQTNTSARLETSESPVNFDFFGGQQQMSRQQPGMLPSLSQQQSGLNDMQQLQQQFMFRKMQELQRQQHLQQVDARQHNSMNQFSSFAKQASGSHSPALINGTPIADASNHPWASELTAGNTNWMQRGSPAVQDSSNGLVFSPDQAQASHIMGLVPQQVDQSLYGIPVSSSRGSLNQYPLMAMDKSSIQQMSTLSNTFASNQYGILPDQVSVPDGILISRHGFQGENLFGHASGQFLNSGINMEDLHIVNSLQRNAPLQESQGRQESAGLLEPLQGKREMQVSSQNAVALDPTEEKILFGSDDNIWDSFGRSANMTGGASNLLDGMGFPSLQSGSWSALMQSAVAETSCSNMGILEEWSGPNFQNTEVAAGNHQPSINDNDGKPQTAFASDSIQTASAIGSGSFSPADNTSMNNNCNSALGFQQSGTKFSYEHGESLLSNSSQRAIQQSSVGSKQLNRDTQKKQLAEGSQIYENASYSLDAEMNAKSSAGPWTSQHIGSSQSRNKPNGWNVTESVSPGGDEVFKSHENKDSLQHSQSNIQKGALNREVGYGGGLWKVNAFPSSTGELVKSSVGSPQVNREDHTSTMRENMLSDASDSQTLPGGKQKLSNQVGRRTSGPRKFQYHPMGNLDEDAEPSYGTRQATHLQIQSLQNSRGFRSHDQGQFGQSKFSGQASKTPPDMGKEQLLDPQGDTKSFNKAPSRGNNPGYVPDVSASFDMSVGPNAPNKTSQSSQNMLELLQKVDQSRERGTIMNLRPSEHNLSSEMLEAEDTEGSDCRLRQSQSSASQGFSLQLAPPTQRLPPLNRSLSLQSSAQTHNSLSSPQTTPEMRDNGHTQLSSAATVHSLPSPSETSWEELKSDRTNVLGQPGGESSLYKMPGNFSTAFDSGFPFPRSQLQNQYMTGASGQVSTNHSINASADRNASQSKQTDESFIPLTGQSADKSHSTCTSHPYERVSASQISVGEVLPVSQPFTTSSISQQDAFPKMSPNTWTNPPAQRHLLGAQGHKISSKFSQSHQSRLAESAPFLPQNLGDQDVGKGGSIPSELGAASVNSQRFVCGEEQLMKERLDQELSSGNIDDTQKKNELQWKELTIKHPSDAGSASPTLTQRDIEAFGRNLKPNSRFHQNYSLLNQMRVMKNSETDPSNGDLKRLKGLDGGLIGQQAAHNAGQSDGYNTMVGDALVPHATIPSGDSKMLSFSGPADSLERNASSHLGNVSYQDMNSQNNYRNNTTGSVRVDNSQISRQMAPSWFSQYGTFKNGQMLPMYDARKGATAKTIEHPFTLGMSSSGLATLNSMERVSAAVDTNHFGNTWQTSSPATVAAEHISSPQSLPPDVRGQGLVVLRPKKRKSAESGHHPWHKEVSQGYSSCQTSSLIACSTAELDWARAANRLTEKVEDDFEMIEDGQPLVKPKRRLILTTQLMQQLIRPPPAAILSADASSNHESVAYFVARLALGDACNLIFSSRSDSNMPRDGTIFLSDQCRISERIDEQDLLKVMDDFMGRARKLENDFLRLDKRASVLDLRVECQDLEKFSVINRFAKFHGRGQAEGADTSSSSTEAASNAQKPYPQRYVTALPLPRNLPDRVQCLSL
ncbi:unnamed protein product [Ilex paraguariensis]|uniref:Uncharacterized protein n=1 Tax=Ilex paraguariensis TaxID=185542 RepID=A0ABC8RSL2_9AQUA